ncbi:MAG: SUMF1/EgtB/PvdO family nonheme iron enzyme [Anaerolineales bacterium]|nr:MAG: SUMF1/EgtB/PvdO family nonheme iron enzyme [Anaerolineales bacterium]
MRKLRVFLCHASDDKPAVRKLYVSLKSVPWIDPWLDEENLLPGQDWDLEIYMATRDADAIIICLSSVSVKKEGYVNKEIRHALDIAQEKPEGAIYVIPLRLDDCKPSFEQLKKLQWADYFTPNAHDRLLKSLHLRADALKIGIPETASGVRETPLSDDGLDLYRFIKIEPQKGSKVDYPFWIGKYPVTNAQYERFLNAPDFANKVYWLEFPKFDDDYQPMGNWGMDGAVWLKEHLKVARTQVLFPRYWNDKNFGKANPNNPVVGISWYEANAYCGWLFQNWDSLAESKANPSAKMQTIRLPLETEWIIAAGGENNKYGYPWDEPDKKTTALKYVLQRANLKDSEIGHTTPVNQYPLGKSSFNVMDLLGNVWEWQANHGGNSPILLCSRGGSWNAGITWSVATKRNAIPNIRENDHGFRVVCIPN